MLRVICVAGARPNFMKIAPLMRVLRARPGVHAELVHTGQHYDREMSGSFFEELGIPKPDVELGVGSGSQALQTARILERFAQVVEARRPHVVVVVGDVNSTLACTLAAVKLGVPVAHVEAGLRSFDRSMPEEINRILVDAVSTYLFTTERSANENLAREGVDPERVHFVGNVMIDTLLAHRVWANASPVLDQLGLRAGRYGVLTLHRPGNVDDREHLERILGAVQEIAREVPVVFPCHPRTAERIRQFGLGSNGSSEAEGQSLRITPPQPYLSFLKLMSDARVVLTDSGGIQEETTILGIPCVTVRTSTERPVTVTEGTNVLAGTDPARIVEAARRAMSSGTRAARVPPLWDGRASERIVAVLVDRLAGSDGPTGSHGPDVRAEA